MPSPTAAMAVAAAAGSGAPRRAMTVSAKVRNAPAGKEWTPDVVVVGAFKEEHIPGNGPCPRCAGDALHAVDKHGNEGIDVGWEAMPQLDGVTHRWIDARGLSMHIAEAGQGDPLILLHGFPQNWWEIRAVMPALAEHFHVIAVDQRGFGWTDAPPRGYDARTLVGDVVALMEQLNIPRARFLSHDWGAIIAQFLAMERPELVEALVITGAPDPHIRPNARLLPLFPRIWHAFALAIPLLGPRLQRNPRFIRHLVTAFEPAGGVAEPDVELYSAAMAQPARAHAGSAVHRRTILPAFMAIIFGAYAKRDFTTPTHALIGALEPSTILQEMGHRAGCGGNVATEILPGEGHFLMDHCPDVVAERTLSFFDRIA